MKEKYKTQKDLMFHSVRGEQLMTRLTLVVLDESEDESPWCELEVSVDYSTYQKIRQEALFNLLADQLLVGSDGSLSERDVEVSLRLKPQLLEDLSKQAVTPEAIANYLTQLEPTSQQRFLLSSESWLATEFTQIEPLPPELQGAGELKVGYQTLWAKPEQIKQQLTATVPVSSIAATVLSYLQDNSIEYEQVNGGILRLKFQGQNGEWVCLIGIDEANNQCVVYSVFPEPVPQEWRKACAVLVANLNYELTIGNFEIDLEDGELRFRTAIDAGGASFTPNLFRQLLTANVNTMDFYLPKLQQFQSL